jgi:hypothetical protein
MTRVALRYNSSGRRKLLVCSLRNFRFTLGVAALLSVLCIGGCGQGREANMPAVDPKAAAHRAIELYDKDHSGSLSESELAASPGILTSRERYDADRNREISEDEIAARLAAIYASGTPWVTAECTVFRGGTPLSGATVRFEPEPFLNDAVPPGIGTTDIDGHTTPAAPDDKIPADRKGLHIIQPGIYRVVIEHASIKQPQRPLGCEIDPAVRGGTEPTFRL